jgi:hypothetical protein
MSEDDREIFEINEQRKAKDAIKDNEKDGSMRSADGRMT